MTAHTAANDPSSCTVVSVYPLRLPGESQTCHSIDIKRYCLTPLKDKMHMSEVNMHFIKWSTWLPHVHNGMIKWQSVRMMVLPFMPSVRISVRSSVRISVRKPVRKSVRQSVRNSFAYPVLSCIILIVIAWFCRPNPTLATSSALCFFFLRGVSSGLFCLWPARPTASAMPTDRNRIRRFTRVQVICHLNNPKPTSHHSNPRPQRSWKARSRTNGLISKSRT